MKRFDYVRATSVDEALAAVTSPGSAILAGGTNLLDLMKTGVSRPDRLVDITHVPGLDRIERLPDGAHRIGAMARNADLAADPHFVQTYPAVAEALLSGASGQLRNMATAGGNPLQRTRCPYFFDTGSRCNRREPGMGCDAFGGDNRSHAVLGWSDACIATHPSDFCVPLVALDAVVETRTASGGRDIPLETLHRLPGDAPHVETILEPGELIVALRLPPSAASFAAHSRYVKLRDRTSYAFAMVSAAAALRIEDGRITEARVALGGVAARPWRAREAEAELIGRAPSPATLRHAGEVALEQARAPGGNAFKIELARRTVARALALAAKGTPQPLPALPASPFAQPSGVLTHA